MRPFVRDGLTALGAAGGYYGCALVGTLLSVPPSGFAVIWPATAFLISVLLILPPGRWWLCAAGVIPTHFLLAATLQPDAPLAVVATQIGGNLLLAAATALATDRAVGRERLFETFASLLTFILVAAIAVPAIVNALILGVHLWTGWAEDFWLSWRQWMIAGFFPTVTIPPLLVLAFHGKLTGSPPASARPWLELGLLCALLFALSYLVLGDTVDAVHWPALFLTPFPFLLFAAVRLGVGGTSVSLLVLAIATIAQALGNEGPFSAQSPADDVFSLQAFLVTISMPLMLLAALMDERRRTADLLRQSDARLQIAASSTDTGLWQWDAVVEKLWLTQNCRAMFGLPDTMKLTPRAFLVAVHPQDRARVARAIEAALASDDSQPPVEFRVRPEGARRWLMLCTSSDLDEAGTLVRVNGVFRDVTERIEAQQEADRLRQRLLSLQDDERRRIAEELHDSTAQHLVAASLNLFNLKAKLPAKMQGVVGEVLQSIREAATEIRTFAYLLHPPQPDSQGLCSVLRQYVPGFERRTGVRTALRVNPLADRLPPEQQHALLRIAQESLGNVHRHARARHVSLSVRCIGGIVHLIVRDDGDGIRPDAGEQLGERLRLGVGIPAMRARVRQLGGRLDVNSQARGTTIHVAIPFQSGGDTVANGARAAKMGTAS